MGYRWAAGLGVLVAVSAGGLGPACAEGSMPLEAVLAAVKGEPTLVGQIEVELRKRDMKAAQVVCSAGRHGDQWKHLGGGLAAPYDCEIGNRTLHVEAERTYFDVNGKRLGKLGQAPDNVLFSRAKSFREGHFRWTWEP